MKLRKCTALLCAFVLLFSCFSVSAFAAPAQETKAPIVFVHGMVGFGAYEEKNFSYWGGFQNMMGVLRDNGYEAYAASVGPLSSAWDRACELYAQLTGTVTDYGEAHAKAHGHDRYGYSYEGRPLMGRVWTPDETLNLVGHSFGGATARLFASLLAYGDEAEKAATGEETSPLFTGGHTCIHSITALSSPHNGAQVANVIYDSPLMQFLVFFVNTLGVLNGGRLLMLDLHLSQFGLTPDENGGRASLNSDGIRTFIDSGDNIGYDLTIRGAKELNDRIRLVEDTYYYSVPTCVTDQGLFGVNYVSRPSLISVFSPIIAATAGKTIDGVKMEGEWLENDGLVPVASAHYPFTDADTALDYEDTLAAGQKLEPGRWYYADTIRHADHLYYMNILNFGTNLEEVFLHIAERACAN